MPKKKTKKKKEIKMVMVTLVEKLMFIHMKKAKETKVY